MHINPRDYETREIIRKCLIKRYKGFKWKLGHPDGNSRNNSFSISLSDSNYMY